MLFSLMCWASWELWRNTDIKSKNRQDNGALSLCDLVWNPFVHKVPPSTFIWFLKGKDVVWHFWVGRSLGFEDPLVTWTSSCCLNLFEPWGHIAFCRRHGSWQGVGSPKSSYQKTDLLKAYKLKSYHSHCDVPGLHCALTCPDGLNPKMFDVFGFAVRQNCSQNSSVICAVRLWWKHVNEDTYVVLVYHAHLWTAPGEIRGRESRERTALVSRSWHAMSSLQVRQDPSPLSTSTSSGSRADYQWI